MTEVKLSHWVADQLVANKFRSGSARTACGFKSTNTGWVPDSTKPGLSPRSPHGAEL